MHLRHRKITTKDTKKREKFQQETNKKKTLVLTVSFRGRPGQGGSRTSDQSGYFAAADARGDVVDNRNSMYDTCKAPVKSSPPTYQRSSLFIGRMP